MTLLSRIKRAVLAGRFELSEKARVEMFADGLLEQDLAGLERLVKARLAYLKLDWNAADGLVPVARLMARARYYPGTPRGITRMWFNGYMATPGSVKAHETRPDGMAKNEETHYQSLFRLS